MNMDAAVLATASLPSSFNIRLFLPRAASNCTETIEVT